MLSADNAACVVQVVNLCASPQTCLLGGETERSSYSHLHYTRHEDFGDAILSVSGTVSRADLVLLIKHLDPTDSGSIEYGKVLDYCARANSSTATTGERRKGHSPDAERQGGSMSKRDRVLPLDGFCKCLQDLALLPQEVKTGCRTTTIC